jgi:hypothetical protein
MPEPEVAGGSNRAARGALALLVLSCGIWLLAPGASRPGTFRAQLEVVLWLAAAAGFLGGIVLAAIGARRVRERGDRALAAAGVALSFSPPVFIAAALVICFVETPGCFS